MLVVSDIDLGTDFRTMKTSMFLKSSMKDFTININNDYRYLKTGYYVSMHAEILGNRVIPSSENIIDANRTPILLLKASKLGIPVLPYVVTDSVKRIMSELDFPVILFAVNPFSYDGYKTAKNRSALYRAVKSLSMNYKFAVCAQPLRGQIISFKSIFGKSEIDTETDRIAGRVYEIFRIPICKLHVQKVERTVYLCGQQPLMKEELSSADLRTIGEAICELSEHGDPLVD